jgi:serine/threonine-protein kinase RsbW
MGTFSMEQIVEVQLPNILGSEKAAIEKAATIAEEMGFSKDRIEDLKTAIAEACINAIEHGNKFDEDKEVEVTLSANDNSLQVTVHDEGDGVDPTRLQKDVVDGDGLPQRRGYGVFLIDKMVNEFSIENEPGKGTNVKMLIHLNK